MQERCADRELITGSTSNAERRARADNAKCEHASAGCVAGRIGLPQNHCFGCGHFFSFFNWNECNDRFLSLFFK